MQTPPRYSVILLCLFLIAPLVFASCHGSTPAPAESQQTAIDPAELSKPQPSPLPGLGLPSPAELAAYGGSQKGVSADYTETGIIHHGKDYEAALPHQGINVFNDSVAFPLIWSGNGLDGVSYCIYKFDIGGWDRLPEVHYGWDDPPEEFTGVWIALANFDANRWDFFRGYDYGTVNVASFQPYTSLTPQRLYAAVIVADSGTSILRYIRLGPLQTVARLNANPSTGVVPYSVFLTASGSSIAELPVEHCEWDLDGDGNYEFDTGGVLTKSFTLADAGTHTVHLRVTNDYGVQTVDSLSLKGKESWDHSWGGDSGDQLLAVAADTGGIYLAGFTTSFGDTDGDGLLIKYSLDGEFQWARAWGGESSERFEGVATDGAGTIYTAGFTMSFGEGFADALVQQWDADGNLLWSRTWGGTGSDYFHDVAVQDGYPVACGEWDFGGLGGGDAQLIAFNLAGELLWTQKYGGGKIDTAAALVTGTNFVAHQPRIFITGATRSFSADDNGDIWYLQTNSVGTLISCKSWKRDGFFEAGTAIAIDNGLSPTAYVAGYADQTSTNTAGIVLSVTSTPKGGIWSPSDLDFFYGIAVQAGSVVLAGSTLLPNNEDSQVLMFMGTDTTLNGLKRFGHADSIDTCNALASFPGAGYVLAGKGDSITGSSWVEFPGTLLAVAGSWVDQTPTTSVVSGTIGSPDLEAQQLTGGVEDTGGGFSDCLVTVTNGP